MKFDTLIEYPRKDWLYTSYLLQGALQCIYCQTTRVRMTIDHIITKSKGGGNDVRNLALACRYCNSYKAGQNAWELYAANNIELAYKVDVLTKERARMTNDEVLTLFEDKQLDMYINSNDRPFASWLRSELDKRGITSIYKLTKDLGLPIVSRQTVYWWVYGKNLPTPREADALCNFFDADKKVMLAKMDASRPFLAIEKRLRKIMSKPEFWYQQPKLRRQDMLKGNYRHDRDLVLSKSARTASCIILQEGKHCIFCESDRERLEVIHLVPIAKGGTEDVLNFVLTCKTCNKAKTRDQVTAIIEERIAMREKIISRLLKDDYLEVIYNPNERPFALWLSKQLEKRRMSAEKLGKKIGMTSSYRAYLWLYGKDLPSLARQKTLCEYLKVNEEHVAKLIKDTRAYIWREREILKEVSQ